MLGKVRPRPRSLFLFCLFYKLYFRNYPSYLAIFRSRFFDAKKESGAINTVFHKCLRLFFGGGTARADIDGFFIGCSARADPCILSHADKIWCAIESGTLFFIGACGRWVGGGHVFALGWTAGAL